MLSSVYTNGGFWISRYEIGDATATASNTTRTSSSGTTGIAVSQADQIPYNYVTCSQAQTLASNMESGNYTSSLMFGVQWELVLKYLETKGTAQADLKTNSTSWGNYNNNLWNITNENSKYYTNSQWTSGAYGAKGSSKSILLSTGASDTFSKQGIYDLAGNVFEWTLEYSSNSSIPCVYREGGCGDYGSDNPAAYRDSYPTTNFNFTYNVGFRASLF